MVIKIGPSGLGGVKEAVAKLERYHKLGFKACEIAFTYGVYIKEERDALEIGAKAKELGIDLTIHGQYWINLNSNDEEKIEKSKERILKCLKVGTWLSAKRVIFHPGFYSKMSPEETYENIKSNILDIMKTAKTKGYTPKLAPEIMGKVNVFGSIDEIFKLKKETGCDMCIDFAHILARYKEYKFDETLNKVKKAKMDNIHIHFSGIVYGEKGEKKHKQATQKEWEMLLNKLNKNVPELEITVISESPNPIKDASLANKIFSKI